MPQNIAEINKGIISLKMTAFGLGPRYQGIAYPAAKAPKIITGGTQTWGLLG
jgi:hypothetical protein